MKTGIDPHNNRTVALRMSKKRTGPKGDGSAGQRRATRQLHEVAGVPRLTSDFQTLFRAAPSPYLVVMPPDFTIVAVNDAYLSATMTEREEILGRPIFDVFPDNPNDPTGADGPRKLLASLGRVVAERRMDQMAVTKYDIPRPAALGGGFEERWWSPRNAPVLDSGGEVAWIIHQVEDVTDRVRAEAAQRESEEKYRTLFNSIDEGFAVFDMIYNDAGEPIDFRYVETNLAFERQAGRRPKRGQTMRELFPEAEDMWLRDYAEVARTRRPKRFVDFNKGLDRWFDVFVFPTHEGSSRLAAIFSDVTERKRVEEGLRESEARLRGAIAISTVAVLFWRKDYSLSDVNDAFLCITGLSREEVIGKSWEELTPPEFHEISRRGLAELVTRGEISPFEKQYYRKDGSRWWGLFTARDLGDVIVEFVIDMTDRKRAEEALRESEENLRAFVSATADIVYEMSADWREMRSLQGKEFIATTDEPREDWREEYIPEEEKPRVWAAINQAIETRSNYELEHRVIRLDGTTGWTFSRAIPLFDEAGKILKWFGAASDITERKRAEEALRESEERMRRAISVPKVGVLFFDLAGHMHEANAAFQQMCGYTIEELRSTTHWDQLTAPEFHELTSHRARDLAETGDTPPYEKEMIRKDGTRWWGLFAPTRLSGSGQKSECVEFVIDITETKRAQEALRESEERLRSLNEQLEERVRERTLELAEANVSLQQEVSERAAAEGHVRDLLRQLVNAQEEERRRISRELHDQFGQELSTLNLRISMLKTGGDGSGQQREQLESMETVVRRLDSQLEFIVRELRPTALDELGLLHALADYVTNWSQHFGIRARVHARELDGEHLPGEVETVLYRITQEALNNIGKHAQAGGVDVILERNADHVSLIVEDDGVGFDLELTDGLGLTGMRERAALVGGSVIIESNPGEGTTVFIRVPAPRVTEGGSPDE